MLAVCVGVFVLRCVDRIELDRSL